MAVIYVHEGGGCEALVREAGNELIHTEIHRYLCDGPAEFAVSILGVVRKKVCRKHAELLKECYGFHCTVESLFYCTVEESPVESGYCGANSIPDPSEELQDGDEDIEEEAAVQVNRYGGEERRPDVVGLMSEIEKRLTNLSEIEWVEMPTGTRNGYMDVEWEGKPLRITIHVS